MYYTKNIGDTTNTKIHKLNIYLRHVHTVFKKFFLKICNFYRYVGTYILQV